LNSDQLLIVEKSFLNETLDERMDESWSLGYGYFQKGEEFILILFRSI